MRDEIWRNRSKGLKLPYVTDKLTEIGIPKFLQGEIIQMVRYRETKRCTDAVEQAMAQAVYNLIIRDLMKQK